MSSVTIEWITTGVFVLCFIAAIIAETLWLIRKSWAPAPKAVAYVMLTDSLSLCIGFFVPFVVLGTILAVAWGGGLSDAGAGTNAALWAAIIFAFVFPFIFLFLTKRAFLALFKVRSGREAWMYSIAATVLSLLISFLPPIVFFYVSKLF